MTTKLAEEEIFLKDPNRWDIWNHGLQSRAVAGLLWDLINPENKDPNLFLPKLVKLDVKNYEK